jgi:DNA polymerase
MRRGIVLVGEAPGEREDRTGLPFQGRSGDFLDRFLEELGFVRDDFFITSAVKCRPPGNRDPRKNELDACRRKWLEAQVAALDPERIVLLGRIPKTSLAPEAGKLQDVHGRTVEVLGRPCLLTYHPTAGMRFPDKREAMRQDFLKLQ